MIPTILVLIGIAIGSFGMGLLWFVSDTGWMRQRTTVRVRVRPLPPATARQIKDAAKANRADLARVRERGWIVQPAASRFGKETR